jgi:hypothetical protein
MFRIFFSILLLTALAVTFAPTNGLCDDHHEVTPMEHGQCTMTCHNCFNGVVTESTIYQVFFKSLTIEISKYFSYQSPTIARLKRPPIHLS